MNAYPGLVVRIDADNERGDVYTLIKPVKRYGLEIPAGFQSDGASVPRFFWRVVFPPGDVHALAAAFLHDYIYRTHPTGWTRKAADDLFLETLIADGVPKRRAYLAYWGVRIFGASAWNEGGKSI